MLSYNQITPRIYIVYENEPWEVISSQVSRKQANKPVNRAKIKNLISERVIEHTFHVSDKVEEAEIESKKIKYLYTKKSVRMPTQSNKSEFWFSEKDDPRKRFNLPETIIDAGGKFLKENSLVDALIFYGKIIGIKLPIKVELKVIEAPPGTKGDTAGGGNKQVTLETGAIITVPLFINEGDVVRVNTETGEYVERV